MKRIYVISAIFILFTPLLFAQIAITEFSYNPPEIGTDSLEYIELYNYSSSPVNLQGYRFTRGVDLIFPNVTIQAGNYLLLSGKASAIQAVYGLPSLQWTSGALNNSGERITIVNAQNTVVIDFTYATTAPWPTMADGTNGEGKSIELCHPLADANNGNNWKVSENDLGFQINGKQVYGTPAAANSIVPCGPEPDVTVLVSSNMFTPRDITINVGQTVRWSNTGGVHNVNGSKDIFPNNPVSFGNGAPSGASWNYDFTFTLPGLYLYQCDPHAPLGMTGSVMVLQDSIMDMYPRRTIAEMKSVNSDGVADSLDVKCTLRGIVHGGNFRNSGLQFTIIDSTGMGIGAFSSSSTFGYTVTEGDELDIKGVVGQFNGLTQILLDDIIIISQGNTLVSPKIVNQFTEADESSLLMIQNVSFTNPSQWTGMGAGFNVTMTNGTTNFTLRISSAIDAYNASIPVSPNGLFNVTGLLGQFDNQSPFTEGYQLFPRYLVDFQIALSTQDDSRTINIKPMPNPATGIVRFEGLDYFDEAIIHDSNGKVLKMVQNKSDLDFSSFNPGLYLVMLKKGKFNGSFKIFRI